MTRISVWCYAGTVDRFSKYPRERRLPDAVKSEEYISMMKRMCFAGVREDFFHEILTDDIGEIFRAIWLVEGHMPEL
jgi:hypothetical protein